MPKLPTGFGPPPDENRPHEFPLAMVLVIVNPMLLLLLPEAVMLPGLLEKTWKVADGDDVPIPTEPELVTVSACAVPLE